MNNVELSPDTYQSAAIFARKHRMSVDKFVEEAVLNIIVHYSDPKPERDYLTLSELRGIIQPTHTGKTDKELVADHLAEKTDEKAEVLEDIRQSLVELKLVKQGKIKTRPLEELLHEV